MNAFAVGPARADDASAVAELVCSLEERIYGKRAFTLADLQEEWLHFDIERDLRVVRDGARVVGYGAIRDRGDLEWVQGYVHPADLGRGIGRLLATELEQAARDRGARRIQNSVMEADGAARALLASMGYEPLRVFREMRIDLDAPPAAPVWPAGLRAETFDRDRDARGFHAAHEEAFADHWEHRDQTYEEFARASLDHDRFEPVLCCCVRDGDEVVAGTINAADTYGGGWVHSLFTRRAWRGRGVGTALLADAFSRLWDHGERGVGLAVDAANPTGAFGLYERAGMTPAMGWVNHEKLLS